MTFRSLLLTKAVVCLIFGTLLLFFPGWLFGVLGATLGAAGLFAAREYAAAMFGTLMLTWFARGTTAADARRAILLALLVYDAIGVVITVVATLSGVLNVLGSGIVAVYAYFTVFSASLLLKEGADRPGAERAPAA